MVLPYGLQRAVNELRSIFSSQWKNGMLPHIRFQLGVTGYEPAPERWAVTKSISGTGAKTSGITQPPNTALSLWRVFENSGRDPRLLPFLEEFYPKLKAYHDFLLTEQDPGGEKLSAIFHPWAAGTDNAPCYLELMDGCRRWLADKGYENRMTRRDDTAAVGKSFRPTDKDYECYGRLIGLYISCGYDWQKIYAKSPFVVQDALFNSILVESIASLAKVATALASHHAGTNKGEQFGQEVLSNQTLAREVASAMREKLYDPSSGLFFNYDVRGRKLLNIATCHSVAPLFGGVASQEQAASLLSHLRNPEEFAPRQGFSVPSTALNVQRFNPLRYWMGPVWPVINWFITSGSLDYDREYAEWLREKTLDMIRQGKDRGRVAELAAALMEFSSVGEEFTTASKMLYCQGWLWDSGFAAVGWSRVGEKKPSPEIFERLYERKTELEKDHTPEKVKSLLMKEFEMPLFDEYFAPISVPGYRAGAPLGASLVTWTAAVYLDLLASSRHNSCFS